MVVTSRATGTKENSAFFRHVNFVRGGVILLESSDDDDAGRSLLDKSWLQTQLHAVSRQKRLTPSRSGLRNCHPAINHSSSSSRTVESIANPATGFKSAFFLLLAPEINEDDLPESR